MRHYPLILVISSTLALAACGTQAPQSIVRAAAGGTAKIYAWDGSEGYGNRVVITHGTSGKTLYAHLGSFSTGDNVNVTAKQSIGAVGRTGLPDPTPQNPTYDHLHFTLYNNAGVGQPIASAAYPMYVRVASSPTATPGPCQSYTLNMLETWSAPRELDGMK